jgi:hypothetical protein
MEAITMYWVVGYRADERLSDPLDPDIKGGWELVAGGCHSIRQANLALGKELRSGVAMPGVNATHYITFNVVREEDLESFGLYNVVRRKANGTLDMRGRK